MAGATAYGSHYFKTWSSCERKGYYQFRFPHPDGGTGLTTRFGEAPLLMGIAVHEALAAYYESYALGHANPGHAITVLNNAFTAERERWAEPQQYEEKRAQAEGLLRRYFEAYGPGGPLDETKRLRVLCDDQGVPLVEREFTFELAPGVVFTCRPDAIVELDGWVYVLEHKTPAIGYVGMMLSGMDVDLQATGECFVVSQLGLPVHGVLVNVLAKGRSQTGRSRAAYPEFMRDPKSRSAAQLEMFRIETIERTRRINMLDMAHKVRLVEGLPEHDAARRTYLRTGFVTGHCTAYNRTCAFMPLCSNPGYEDNLIGAYAPARKPDDESPLGTSTSEDTA